MNSSVTSNGLAATTPARQAPRTPSAPLVLNGQSDAASVSRAQAATLLRDARRSLGRDLDLDLDHNPDLDFSPTEACHWALMHLPRSRAAQRCMIDCLIRSGALNDAAALVSAAMRQGSERDWKLWHRRARILLAQQRVAEADDAVSRALALEPRRFHPLLLAADIARAQGDHERALHMLDRASSQRPRDARLAPRMIDSLLALDRTGDAEAVLIQMHDAPADLAARVLMAQHRLCDARLTLQAALDTAPAEFPFDRHAVQACLVDVLERSGDWPALREMARDPQAIADDPAVATRLASALLAMGEYATAAKLCEAVLERSGERPDARATLGVAKAALNHDAAVARDIASSHAGGPRRAAHCSDEASQWLRGLLGVVVVEQCDARAARRAGADPTLSVLTPLLHRALAAFDRALEAKPDAPDAQRWRTLRQRCWNALYPAGATNQFEAISSVDGDPCAPQREAAPLDHIGLAA